MGFNDGFFEVVIHRSQGLLELSVVEGCSVLHFVERSKGVFLVVYMGKLTMEWLLANVEALVRGEAPKEFIKSHRFSSRAFLAQRCMNSHGSRKVPGISRVWRGFVIIPEGMKGMEELCAPLSCEG
jgi:hypothetical protein